MCIDLHYSIDSLSESSDDSSPILPDIAIGCGSLVDGVDPIWNIVSWNLTVLVLPPNKRVLGTSGNLATVPVTMTHTEEGFISISPSFGELMVGTHAAAALHICTLPGMLLNTTSLNKEALSISCCVDLLGCAGGVCLTWGCSTCMQQEIDNVSQ